MSDDLLERLAKLCEQEAFKLEAIAKDRRTLAADLRFSAKSRATLSDNSAGTSE